MTDYIQKLDIYTIKSKKGQVKVRISCEIKNDHCVMIGIFSGCR